MDESMKRAGAINCFGQTGSVERGGAICLEVG